MIRQAIALATITQRPENLDEQRSSIANELNQLLTLLTGINYEALVAELEKIVIAAISVKDKMSVELAIYRCNFPISGREYTGDGAPIEEAQNNPYPKMLVFCTFPALERYNRDESRYVRVSIAAAKGVCIPIQ